jgi:serine/threonine protein kinase
MRVARLARLARPASESDAAPAACLTECVRNCPKCGTAYPDEVAYCPLDGTQNVPAVDSGAPADPFVGQTIDGRYRIEARIGEGGMGVVYRAIHVLLKKTLAIKVMRGEQANEPEVVQRFVQEARASSAIGHPNIVNISDFGTTPDGAVYFAMEYLQGQTLAEAMQTGPIQRERAVGIFIQIASALQAAHESGIVHRDLKPDNIFLIREPEHDDFVKVLDFGIAKVKNAAAKITRTGMVFGTPHYMSPEQAAGQAVDHRSDIYSLGVIMYQVFAGQLPFDAESYMGVMTKHMFEEPVLPSRWTAELRGSIEDIIMKALQKKAEQRYQSMLQLREDLERAHSGQPIHAYAPISSEPALAGFTGTQPALEKPYTGTDLDLATDAVSDDERVSLPMQKRPVWLLLLIGALLLGFGLVSFGIWGGGAEAVPTPAAPTGNAAPHVVDPKPVTPPSAADPHAPPAAEAPPLAERAAPPEKKPRPSVAPKPSAPRRAPAKRDRGEVVDPWR